MACKIIRNQDTGKIDYVTAPNGERSELFDKIRDNSPNLSDDNLLREYAKYYVDKPEYNLDQNQNIDNSDITFKIDPFGKSIDNIRVDLKGNDIGYVQISKNNTTKILTVTGIELKEKGNGKKVYIKLRDTYPDFTIKSDPVNLSPDAINMWDSLVRNNLAIKNGEKDYTLLQGNSDPIYYRLDESKEVPREKIESFELFEDINRLCPDGVCNYTAKKSTEHLQEIGLNPYPNAPDGSQLPVIANSPLGNFKIVHYVSAVAINDIIYVFDMPQHEFISNDVFGHGSNVPLKDSYKPRLIPLTLDEISANYNLNTSDSAAFIHRILINDGWLGSEPAPSFKQYIRDNIKNADEYISILEEQVKNSDYEIPSSEPWTREKYLKDREKSKKDFLNKRVSEEDEDKVLKYYSNKLKIKSREYVPTKASNFSINTLLNSVIGDVHEGKLDFSSFDNTLASLQKYLNSPEFIDDLFDRYTTAEINSKKINTQFDNFYSLLRLMESFINQARVYGIQESLTKYDSDQQYKIRTTLPPNILDKYESKEQAALMLSKYWANKDNIVRGLNIAKNYKSFVNDKFKKNSIFNKYNTILNYLKLSNFDTNYLYEVISKEATRKYDYFKSSDLNPIYYRLDEPQKEKAIQQLDDYLLNFLDNFGVTSKDISEFKALKGIDALGVTDTLNKVIYFAQNRDSYTIPEEAAHMLIMLMGKNHPDIKALLDRIESWEGFQQVYNDYINVYDNPMKVKIEAAAKLLSEALVGNYKEVGLDKTLIDRVLESVNNILNTLRSLINKMAGVFLEPGDKIFNFVDNPSWSYHIADKIALNILKGNKDYVFKIPDNIRRVRPVETLKANEFAREFIEDVTDNYVTKLTGSVALAAQGEVYRESEDYLHDLDFTVLWDHNSWSQILKPFLDTKYKMLLVNSFWNSDQNTVQYLVMPLNSESEKVRVLKSPDDKIMIENLPEIYTYVDFFFGGYSGTRADINEGKQYEAWENIILAKQSFSRDNIFMSRPKDQQDYVLFSNIGDSRYVDPKNIFYRLDKNGELLAVEHDLDNIDLKYDYKSTDEGDVMNISFTYDDTEIGNAELNVDDNSWNLDAISIYPPYQGKKIGSYVTKLIAKDAAKADAVLKVEKTSPAGKNLQLRLQEDGYMKYDPATDSFSSTIFPSWYLSQESDLLDGNSSKGFVDSMSNQMNYYYHNQLANELKPNLSNINIAENEELTQNANSYYDASSNTIFLAPSLDLFTKYNAFLNSYFKASVINTLQGKDSLSKELLTDIFDDVKLRLRQAGIDQIIDLRNSPELINSLFSDTYFIEVLKKTPALDKYNNLIGDDIEYPSLYMQILKVIANENKLSNIQLPILDQILSTQAELLRSNNDVQLDYSVYFNTDVVEDTSISGMTYDDLVDLYEASKLEPTNTDNFSNFPKGTKKSTTKKDALKQFRFTKEQKEAAAKFQETASRIKEARIVSIEEVEKAAKGSALKNVKLLKKFVDKTVRYIITDTEGREIIVPLRPSDLGKIEFAKNRKFDRAEIELMDSSRDNIIARGMGTTLHGIQELIINELEKQNEDGLLLSNYTLGNANDFYKKQYSKFLSKIDNGELKKIWDSLNKKGTYTREFSKEELLGITDTDIADSDRKFTIDKADFDNLASLAFKLYHQIYERQAQLDSNSSVKHRPMILTETKVLNEDEGIAGSLDVLVIYQDKDTPKYGFYDYKFISFNREMNLSNKPADAETIKKQKLETTYTRRDGTVVSKEAANIKGRDYNEYAVRDKLRAKYSSFNHQVTAYKDALLKGYSLKKDQILESRVIPVNMVLKTVKTGNIITRTDETGKVEKINETKIVPTINFIDHDHDLLSQIPFAGELTDDSKINQFLEQLLAKRDKLFKTIKVRPGDEKLQKQLQDIEFIIKSLQLKKDIKAISERLLYIAKDVEKAITRPKMLGNKNNPLYYSDTDLVFAEDMLNFYSNFQESVAFEYDRLKRENENTKDAVKNSNFKDIEEALTNQNLKISVLLEKLKSVREQRLLDYADSTVAVELEDNFKVDLSVSSTDLKNMGLGSKAKESLFSDISGIQSWVYGISDWDNPITYMAKQIFDNINYEVKAYTESVTSKIEKQRDNLRKYADRRGISPIKVWDIFIDNYYGNTGRFVSQLSQDFYKKKNEAITKKDIKWLKENLIFDKDRYAKQYEKEKARLLKSYGVEDLTKEPEKAKIINGKLKAFESRFNMDLSDNAYYNRNNYFWKVSPATSSKWESEKWKIIKANPELLEFHTFYLDMIEEIKELTGESRINRSFIPQVHKDTVDILSKDFFSFDAVKNLYKSFVATSKIRTEDEVVGLVIDEEVINEVPFKFVDEVHVENLLTDLTKSLMLLAYSAKNYQLANAAKGTLEAIKLTIADTKFTEKTMYGNKKKGKLVKGEISNLYAGYTKQLGYHIYGQTLQSSKFNSTVGSAGDINIAKVLRKVMHFYSQKSLAFNTKSIIGGHFNVKAQLRQIAKKGNHYTLKNLNKMETVFASLNKNAHIFNEIFKVSQEGNAGLIWEQANRLSISKLRQMWSKPISFYLQRRSDDAMDAHLLYSMLDNYVLHPDGKTIFPLSKKNKYLKGTKWENTELKTMWDSLLIDEATGDDVPNMKIMSFDGSTQMTKLQFMQFRQRVRTLMARARGNASNEDIANYRNTLEGQLLGQFKAWIPTTLLLERTGQARYNYSLDELEIGRYRVFLGESFKGMIPRFSTFAKMLGAVALFKSKNLADIEISRGIYNKWRIDNPELSDKVTFEEFIKTRSDQLAAMAAELRIYLMVWLGLLGIGFAAGDDERKKNPFVRTLTTHMERVLLEIGFYFDPSQTVQIITRGPIPLFNMVVELKNLMANSIGEMQDLVTGTDADKKISFLTPGDEPFTLNIWEEETDKTGPFTYTFRFVPGLKGINDLLQLINKPQDKPTLLEWLFSDDNYKYR